MLAGTETNQVPHRDEKFRQAMREQGFDPDDAPYELMEIHKSFPVVGATMKAMKEAGYRPLLSRK